MAQLASPPLRVSIDPTHGIADTGATSIFVQEGIEVPNIQVAINPLTVNLPDGRQVRSTHTCDVIVPGLPKPLTGHVIPDLAMASLFGIRPLCNAGCVVIFHKDRVEVHYKGNVILIGPRNMSTDLWTLPIAPKKASTLLSSVITPHDAMLPAIAAFTHSVRTRLNAIRFTHQALGNPKISTLLKAVRRGFLKGCPNLSETLILKYLNPSPATAKGHMKRPRQGIRSTTPRPNRTNATGIPMINDAPIVPTAIELPTTASNATDDDDEDSDEWDFPAHLPPSPANLIVDDDSNPSIANVFAYGAFADKHSGVVYHNLTGSFPFMSLDGSVCFFVRYHYESNSILAEPIKGLDDKTIFEAYKKFHILLTDKGYSVKLNVMDNQATRYIKKFLTENECKLQLVEPHNHRVNAAERAIQTWKDAFIAALATTDRDFPIQLWDRLTPQVMNTLNMLRASRINPSISAYEALHGPYDWNRYPLAPLGCKAVIYEDGDIRGSWASRGVDGWYLGPSVDHYRCDVYYVPETRAYRVSGTLTPHQHLRALTDELASEGNKAGTTTKGRRLLTLLQSHIGDILTPPPVLPPTLPTLSEEQRVIVDQQRVIDASPISTIPRITNAPAIMNSHNPTAKRNIKTTPLVHRRKTRNNTPGGVPLITRAPLPPIVEDVPASDDTIAPPSKGISSRTRSRIPMARSRLVTRHAINFFALTAAFSTPTGPRSMMSPPHSPQANTIPHQHTQAQLNLEHYANPMVHPVTGKTISSYRKLMNDPVTAETWQTAFGKDFGGMAQGDNKTGQRGTNAMFVMNHSEIKKAYSEKKFFTFANPVVDYRPQKDDPNRIRITAMGNLITYDGELSVRTADINTAKIHWNSVVSTPNAKYMCLDIKNFYLTAALEYYEYMKMPLSLFPTWTVDQYNLNTHAKDGWVHLEMRRAVWGLPQAGILANKRLRRKLAPFGYSECIETPGLWVHETRPISFTLVVDDFGVKYVNQEDVDHLIASVKHTYTLTEDWSGDLYCGIKLNWDYVRRTVDISMPGYIQKKLQEYEHVMPKKPQHCPYSPEPKQFGSEAQRPLPGDSTPFLDDMRNCDELPTISPSESSL